MEMISMTLMSLRTTLCNLVLRNAYTVVEKNLKRICLNLKE